MATKVPTKEDELLKFLISLDEEMEGYKDGISQGWDQVPQFFTGSTHWPKLRPSHKTSPVLNFLEQAIERRVALLTDARPFIQILPYKDAWNDIANVLVQIFESKWAEQDFSLKICDLSYFAQLFGSVGTNTLFDKTLDHGRGDITINILDPRILDFDPWVTTSYDIDKAEYIRIMQVLPTSLLKWQYPGKKIKADANQSFTSKRQYKIDSRGRRIIKLKKSDKESAIDRSLVKEYWVVDRKTKKNSNKLVYPGGRHIKLAGEALVLDEANPYIDNYFPVDFLYWHKDPDNAWGKGDILNLKEVQTMLNKLIAIITESGLLMSNPIWIGDYNALEEKQWNELDNIPGLKVKKRPHTELKREKIEPIPASTIQLVAYLEKAIEKLLGHTEVVQGKSPGEVKSGIAIEALQTAAQALIRLNGRKLEGLMQRVGQKFIARIFQFETNDRLMWRLNKEDEFVAFKYFRKNIIGKGKQAQDMLKDFLFKIRPDSFLAMTRWQKAMLYTQWYQMGLVDREKVLEELDIEGKEEMIARMEAKEQAEMEAMVAAGQQKGGKGSATKVTSPGSPHAQQGVQEGIFK